MPPKAPDFFEKHSRRRSFFDSSISPLTTTAARLLLLPRLLRNSGRTSFSLLVAVSHAQRRTHLVLSINDLGYSLKISYTISVIHNRIAI
ncbi:hypothetical protein L1887_14742 [Cichorium endivia]|nr:hypothetical protein L1887_14742 [Cichorium endivia]